MALDPSTGHPEKPFFKKVSSIELTQAQKDIAERVRYLHLQATLAVGAECLTLVEFKKAEFLLYRAMISTVAATEAESALSQAQAMIEKTVS